MAIDLYSIRWERIKMVESRPGNAFLPILLCFLASCTTQTASPILGANFQFSHAGGMGTQNAGFYQPGTLFAWDTAGNTLTRLATLPLSLERSDKDSPGSQTSTSVASLSIAGLPGSLAGDAGAIGASLAGRAKFSAKGAYREDYAGTITGISSYVAALVAEGQDPDDMLGTRDPLSRLVIINSVLRATESTLSIGGTDASDPDKVVSVSLSGPSSDLISAKVRIGTNTSCSGSEASIPPACFFNVLVLQPYYEEGNPRLQLRRIPTYNKDDLSNAFRGI